MRAVRSGLAFISCLGCLGACSFQLPDGNPTPVDVDAPSGVSPDATTNVACPAEYALVSGTHKLRLTDIAYTWQSAQAFCAAHQGHLVKIEDKPLDDFIRDNVLEGAIPFVWIGLYDPLKNLTYKWYDNTPLGTYKNFDPTATNGDCVDKDTADLQGTWHAWDCSFLQLGVCECDG